VYRASNRVVFSPGLKRSGPDDFSTASIWFWNALRAEASLLICHAKSPFVSAKVSAHRRYQTSESQVSLPLHHSRMHISPVLRTKPAVHCPVWPLARWRRFNAKRSSFRTTDVPFATPFRAQHRTMPDHRRPVEGHGTQHVDGGQVGERKAASTARLEARTPLRDGG